MVMVIQVSNIFAKKIYYFTLDCEFLCSTNFDINKSPHFYFLQL